MGSPIINMDYKMVEETIPKDEITSPISENTSTMEQNSIPLIENWWIRTKYIVKDHRTE